MGEKTGGKVVAETSRGRMTEKNHANTADLLNGEVRRLVHWAEVRKAY